MKLLLSLPCGGAGRRWFTRLVSASVLLCLPTGLAAEIAHALLAFTESNYTGYVISSDKNNPDPLYNRDAIEVGAEVEYTRSGTSQHHYMYRFRFQLLDSDDVPQALDLGGGTGTTLEVFEEIDMTGGPAVITRTTAARVAPAASVAALDPQKEYRVKVTVSRRRLDPPSLIYSLDLFAAETAAQQYKHFRQLVEGDAALNVIAELTGAGFSRIYRVQPDPGNDAFRLAANLRLYRYDEFSGPWGSDEVIVRLSVVLRDDQGNAVPLQQSVFDIPYSLQRFWQNPPRKPSVSTPTPQLDLRPQNQLLSRSRTYYAEVTVGHFETPGAPFPLAGDNETTPTVRLLDFNGGLLISGVGASFGSIATPGPESGELGGDYVATSLRVNNQSGDYQGMAFGNGGELQVELRDTGTATVTGGTINLSGSGVPLSPGGIHYTLEGITVTPAAITGNVRLRLPSGFGLGFNAVTRIHEPEVVFPGVELTSQFKPVAPTLSLAGNWWGAEESKPVLFEVSAVLWDVDDDRIRLVPTGSAEFVRKEPNNALLLDEDVHPLLRVRRSNDHYYWNLGGVSSPEVVVNIAGPGGAALLTADFALGGVLFYRTHFPYDAQFLFSGGSQRVVDDRVAPAFGGLSGVGTVSVPYGRDCPAGDCGGLAGLETLAFVADDSTLRFTRDGGLTSRGVLAAPQSLNWGWIADKADFAHSAQVFVDAGFHMSGVFLAATQLGSTNPVQRPARLLYTGVDPLADDGVERPGTNAYKAGLGDYAGLNFRVVDWGDQDGRIVIAGQLQPLFPLTNRAKYLVRRGGVSGIHEAINGQFTPTATIYGVDFEFSSLGWGFLDGEAVISRTGGNLYVQFPSDFDLDFDKLMITCLGALEGAEISPADHGAFKKLAYWNADFRPLALSFEGKLDAICDPGDRRLVLGVEAYAGGVEEPLSGRIAFQLNGNLVTLASGDLDAPFDSRLRLPNNFSLAGPGNQSYRATPVGEAYLNDYAVVPDADFGWMNLAAYLDVPFFSDLEAHIHTSAVKDDDNVLYHIMGGYPDDGYKVNGGHFFNESIFDVSNRGFPGDVTFAEYRSGVAEYRPVAVKRWLGVIDFKYPLTWRPASRSFVSFEDVGSKLLVLESEHRVDYLSPDFVDVSFGASLSLIPQINIANFVSDKAGDVLDILQEHLVTEVVDAGVQGLNEILDVKQRAFFEKALQPAIDTTVDAVMDALLANWNGPSKTWAGDVESVVNGALNHVNTGAVAQLREKLEAARDTVGVLQEIDARLALAENTLNTMEGFIEEKNGVPLGDLQSAILGLANLVSAALDKPEFQEKIEALLERAEPRMIEVRNAIGEIRDFIVEVRSAMDQGGQFAEQMIDLIDDQAASMQAAVNLVGTDILAALDQVQPGLDSFPAMEDAIRAKVKQRIQDYMLGLPVIAEINRLIKQRVYDTSALLTAAIDEVFDQINLTVRDIVCEVAGGLDDKFNEMLDDLGATMATADIKGYAKVRNDSLTELRLDLKAQMNVPDEMKAHVFLLIRELSSENTPAECLPASGKSTEVTMGAKDVSVEWLFPDTTMNLQAKFVMEGIVLRGMGGGIDLQGEISFGESVIIRKLGASVMFGLDENYISAAAQIEVQGFQGGGGIFLGKACSLDPFFWDDTVAAVIGEPPFTGMYGYGEFWIPIPTLIGIPSTCLFNLSAGVGAGAGFFLEGPTVFGKMFLGVSGDVLCIISITGEISLVGLARPSGLALAGKGRFAAELGWCPLCLSIEKSILLARENKKWTHKVE
jgi:hypothetical protein